MSNQKTSSQDALFILKLRKNIVLEGDLSLAKLELQAFFPHADLNATDVATIIQNTPQINDLQGFSALTSHARPNGKQAYTVYGPLSLLPLLIRHISFIQRIYCLTDSSENACYTLQKYRDTLGPIITSSIKEHCLIIQAIPHYTLIEISDVIVSHSTNAEDTKHNLSSTLKALLDQTSERHAIKLADIALSAQSTTSHLSHDIHYYKAKFFPRMARSLLNICIQRLGDGPHRAIDNFAGSGTMLLEASMLGIPSVGLDIDPLSVMIAKTKLRVTRENSFSPPQKPLASMQTLKKQNHNQLTLFDKVMPESTDGITFPAWLMKNRKMTPEIAEELRREINVVKAAISTADPATREVLKVFMSDAITRKIRMRFMGTGVGRFSLTFAKTPIPQMFAKAVENYMKVMAVCEWLQQTIFLEFADAQVFIADTRHIPEEIGQFDMLVASPPYLPASSGRESYTKARAPSLIALEMRSHEDVDDLVDDTIGSMNGHGTDIAELTTAEREVVDWLALDPLRAIKAEPVARYFLDMRQTFIEMYRVLQPGALAVVVSGKTSTFYQFSTREALYVVNCAELLADEARRTGFIVENLHDIQLFKSNRNARPRSLDDYYETLIFMRKPV